MCGDARNWNEADYRESIFKDREIHTRTVFRTAWSPPSQNPNPESIVVASSDGSIASYSLSSCLSNLLQPSAFSNTGGQQVSTPEPDVFVQGHEGPAYDVKFYDDGEDAILLSCGDDGHIRGWRWKEFKANKSKGNHVTTVLDLANPQHKGPWGALSPIPENNALAVDVERKSIYAAAGDSCAYCWDVETGRIKMVFKGHSNYLHCIVARNSSSQIITGSEDGTARIWDCRSSKCIQVIDPNKDFKMQGSSTCVSCIALDASESWLACGSGSTLTVWNLPSSDCIVNISTGAPTQDVLFENNHILEVGAKPVITRFDMNGEILSEVQCAPLSAFSLSLHQSGVIAVGGYGGLVDIISQFGSHLCTFRCECVYGSTV